MSPGRLRNSSTPSTSTQSSARPRSRPSPPAPRASSSAGALGRIAGTPHSAGTTCATIAPMCPWRRCASPKALPTWMERTSCASRSQFAARQRGLADHVGDVQPLARPRARNRSGSRRECTWSRACVACSSVMPAARTPAAGCGGWPSGAQRLRHREDFLFHSASTRMPSCSSIFSFMHAGMESMAGRSACARSSRLARRFATSTMSATSARPA